MDKNLARMVLSERERAISECAALCRQVMDEADAEGIKETADERRDIVRFALRALRYHTAKNIMERMLALPSE